MAVNKEIKKKIEYLHRTVDRTPNRYRKIIVQTVAGKSFYYQQSVFVDDVYYFFVPQYGHKTGWFNAKIPRPEYVIEVRLNWQLILTKLNEIYLEQRAFSEENSTH